MTDLPTDRRSCSRSVSSGESEFSRYRSFYLVAERWLHRSVSVPPPLWRSHKHQRLSSAAICRMLDQLVHGCVQRRLVLEITSADTLRHTFAMSDLKDNPGDLIGLATLLDHSLSCTAFYNANIPLIRET